MATPPASVAFWISTIENFPFLRICENRKAPMQEPQSESTVFTITRCCEMGSARAPLKLGQNIHRNKVPTIANVSEILLDPFRSWPEIVVDIFLPKTHAA